MLLQWAAVSLVAVAMMWGLSRLAPRLRRRNHQNLKPEPWKLRQARR